MTCTSTCNGNGTTPRAPAYEEPGQLFRLAMKEAEKHKWIESEKAGRDLGEAALWDWSRRYWRHWCRERWIEHLSGEHFWSELDRQDFGLLQRGFHSNTELVHHIVVQIKDGGENLDIIRWAYHSKQDVREVVDILKLLDINSRRLNFWPT